MFAWQRRTWTGRTALLALAVASLVLVGCGDDDSDELGDTGPAEADHAELLAAFEAAPAPPLDLDTRQASFDGGELTADAWSDTHVGRVTDDLFIGVRAEPGGDEVTVYLCDDHLSILLAGTLDDGAASLSDERAQVDLELADGVVTGSVIVDGGDEVTFTASVATGDAGVYVADGEVGGFELEARWIVLEDGEQRGSGNVRCFIHPIYGHRVCFEVK